MGVRAGTCGQSSTLLSRLPWALPTAGHVYPSGVARTQVSLASLLHQHACHSHCSPSPQQCSSENARMVHRGGRTPDHGLVSHGSWVSFVSLFGATQETWVGAGELAQDLDRQAFSFLSRRCDYLAVGGPLHLRVVILPSPLPPIPSWLVSHGVTDSP